MATDRKGETGESAIRSGDPGALLSVSVCHAGTERIWLATVRLPRGATVADALLASGFAAQIPQIDLSSAPVGIFGKKVARNRKLSPGDRVEIYRPLAYDPKESRRRRAQHRSRLRGAAQGTQAASVDSAT